MTAFLIAGFIGGSVVVAATVLWPQRPPKDRSVEEIRRRIESEDAEHPLP